MSDKVAGQEGSAGTQATFKILCFGDSLTSGYMLTSPQSYPYGDVLQTELAKKLSVPLSNVHVDIDGLPGDQVSGAYIRRLKKRLEKAESTKRYDYIILMGGTNDLGWGQPAEVIFQNLKIVWQRALDSGANLVALNIIETARGSDAMIKRRADLNGMIAGYQHERFHAFDLWSIIRYTGVDPDTRARIWDDGLHLTAEGYNTMELRIKSGHEAARSVMHKYLRAMPHTWTR